MPGIIPFFNLEDPEDIRERLDVYIKRRHDKAKARKRVRSEILEAHQLEPQVLPGQAEFNFTNKL